MQEDIIKNTIALFLNWIGTRRAISQLHGINWEADRQDWGVHPYPTAGKQNSSHAEQINKQHGNNAQESLADGTRESDIERKPLETIRAYKVTKQNGSRDSAHQQDNG